MASRLLPEAAAMPEIRPRPARGSAPNSRLNGPRRRRVGWNVLLAFLSLAASLLLTGLAAVPADFRWIFPVAGCVGYLYFAQRAVSASLADLDALPWPPRFSSAVPRLPGGERLASRPESPGDRGLRLV
jgi:hypothetical protein